MIIFPGLIGSVARAGKTVVVPPAPLNLQISLDFSVTWQEEEPVTDFSPINGFMGSRTYDLRALGSGTENIFVNINNFNFSAFLSDSTITGNSTNIQLFVSYNNFGSDSAQITISCSGGDSIILNVSGQ